MACPRIWDAATGQLMITLPGHALRTFEVKFSPDGKQLATASPRENAAILWDIATSKELITLTGHSRPRVLARLQP